MSDLRILRQRTPRETTTYALFFSHLGHHGTWGYGFGCDAQGNLLPLSEAATASLAHCRAHPEAFEAPFIQTWQSRWSDPAQGRCECGRTVVLERDPEECPCGRFYNLSGQALAHPSQWGEETGERFDDHGRYVGGGEL